MRDKIGRQTAQTLFALALTPWCGPTKAPARAPTHDPRRSFAEWLKFVGWRLIIKVEINCHPQRLVFVALGLQGFGLPQRLGSACKIACLELRQPKIVGNFRLSLVLLVRTREIFGGSPKIGLLRMEQRKLIAGPGRYLGVFAGACLLLAERHTTR